MQLAMFLHTELIIFRKDTLSLLEMSSHEELQAWFHFHFFFSFWVQKVGPNSKRVKLIN